MPALKASDAHAIFLSLTPCQRRVLRKLTPKPSKTCGHLILSKTMNFCELRRNRNFSEAF
jgi:hypothetical protein